MGRFKKNEPPDEELIFHLGENLTQFVQTNDAVLKGVFF